MLGVVQQYEKGCVWQPLCLLEVTSLFAKVEFRWDNNNTSITLSNYTWPYNAHQDGIFIAVQCFLSEVFCYNSPICGSTCTHTHTSDVPCPTKNHFPVVETIFSVMAYGNILFLSLCCCCLLLCAWNICMFCLFHIKITISTLLQGLLRIIWFSV